MVDHSILHYWEKKLYPLGNEFTLSW